VLLVLIGFGEWFVMIGEGIEVEYIFSECFMGVLRVIIEGFERFCNIVQVLLVCVGEE